MLTKTKIGIVDDSELLLSSISLLLETLGDYEVVIKAMYGHRRSTRENTVFGIGEEIGPIIGLFV